METFAYLHLACAFEADDTPELRFDFSQWNWQRLRGQVGLRLLAIVVPLTILAVAGQALADLQVGNSGPEVISLQQQLKAAKYFDQNPTGNYGPVTKAAVQRFQKDHGLYVDGIAGPDTLQALNSYLNNRNNKGFEKQVSFNNDSELRSGSRGPKVEDLQWKLTQVGHQIKVDGVFGPETDRAVQAFQRDQRLPITGIVDTETMNTLNQSLIGIEPKPPNPSNSYSGYQADVYRLQERLYNLGYDPGSIDGILGSKTETAVKQFQRNQGLPATGVADQETLIALGLAQGGKRFVVVVPMGRGVSLARVRQVTSSAIPVNSRLGKFIQAGAYPNRAAAEIRARKLRGEGLDAQVRYF